MISNPTLRVLTRDEHSIQDSAIHPDAWKVLRRLHHADHTAYLVGGTVRDLYLGRQPKDFDVATTAKPNDIKRLFRNAFMIGRRFRLAHIKFFNNIIEVATFRKETDRFEEPTEEGGDPHAIRLYGTPEEDARRRDFTINGLFYDPFRGHVIDYVGGLDDMSRRLVRTISPPEQSFEEDPARMVRAVRAAARLGFMVEMRTHQMIVEKRANLLRCPRARLLEELLILLKYNSAERSLRLLWQLGLMEFLLPMHHAYLLRQNQFPLESPKHDLLFDLMSMLDLESSHVDPPVLFSLLVFPFIVERMAIVPKTYWTTRPAGSLLSTIDTIFSELGKSVDVSKKFRAHATEILMTQNKLLISQGHIRPEKLVHKPYFRDSLRFFQIAPRAVDLDVRKDLAIWQKFKQSQPPPVPAPVQGELRPPKQGPSDHSNRSNRSHRRRRSRRHGRTQQHENAPSAPSSNPPAAPE